MVSKSIFSNERGLRKRSSSALAAAASSSDQRFLTWSGRPPGSAGAVERLDAGVAGGLADADQLLDQGAQALALGDLRAGSSEGSLGNGAGPGLAVDAGREHPMRAVAAASGWAQWQVGMPHLR